MDNEKNKLLDTKWTACERWHFTGHTLLATGTLCISIAHLLQLASSGKISDFSGYQPSSGRQGPQMTTNHHDSLSPMDYFRRG